MEEGIASMIKHIVYPPDTQPTLSKWLFSWQPSVREELQNLIKVSIFLLILFSSSIPYINNINKTIGKMMGQVKYMPLMEINDAGGVSILITPGLELDLQGLDTNDE